MFRADVPPGDYALTITSTRGFAFVEHTVVPNTSLQLALSHDCSVARGHVSGEAVRGTTVTFSRYSSFTGDLFVGPVDPPSGEFSLCLPTAKYVVRLEGPVISQTHPVTLPATAAIEIPGWSRATIERAHSNGTGIATADLASMVTALRDGPRVLGLGEANHGTAEFYSQRGVLTLALARTGNVRYVLVEADAMRMWAIDDYANGGQVDIETAVAALRFWITDVREFYQFLTEVRKYNEGVGPAQRLHVLGIDAQRPEPAAEFLISHRADLSLRQPEIAILTRVSKDRAALTTLDGADGKVLDALLDRLAMARRADLLTVPARASIAAKSLRHQLAYGSKSSAAPTLRDVAMADIATTILNLGGKGRACLWAHNGHVAREVDGGTQTLGQYLARRFPDYYPIAFLSYEGVARAWDAAGEIGVIPSRLGPTPSFNLESAIMAEAQFPDVAWVRLDTASGPLKKWLEIPRYVREFGSAHTQDNQTLRRFPAAFAAVVVIKNTSASTPTPTGERRIEK